MNLDRFDDVSRNLTSLPSRRGVLGGLASALFATLPLALGGADAAAKKKKKKGKNKKRKQTQQRPPVVDPSLQGCTPSCATGNACGPDGCGGSCGSCALDHACDSGTCVCAPQCAATNACGADGCGGSCGPCVPNTTCHSTTELATNVCNGGTCQRMVFGCGFGQVCFENACCTKRTSPTCRKQAVSDGCGGTLPANCAATQFCCEGSSGDLVCQSTPCQ